MHVHAGDEQLSEPKSAKFFVRDEGASGDVTCRMELDHLQSSI